MSWQRLIDIPETRLVRGYLLKYPENRDKKDWRLMMLCEAPYGEGGVGLIRLDGYDAGINPYVVFPNDRESEHFVIFANWLIANWNKWVCPEGDVNNVLVRAPLDAAEM